MNFEVILTPNFQKEAKKLLKKYPSLKNDLTFFGENLSRKPDLGTHLGNQVFKVRLNISSKSKGKSGGARIITLLKLEKNKVFLVSIYDKSVQANISKEKIARLIKNLG